jgi:hypothetical protein
MIFESKVVNCEARVSSVEAVDEGVLSMAAWREAVWLMRSGVLLWYSFMWCCEGEIEVVLVDGVWFV